MPEVTLPRASVCQCRFAGRGTHHDRLVRAESDVTVALELLELALTWDELDYSREALIPPDDWLEFAGQHQWRDRDVAERLFSAVLDVARRGATVLTADLVRVTRARA